MSSPNKLNMDVADLWMGWLKLIRRPGFWLILGLFAAITIPHYDEALKHPAFLVHLTSNLGLTRHAFERILYLAPILWAGFLFGGRGVIVASLVALAGMLPRAIFISPTPRDAMFETAAVFIIGNVAAITFMLLRREREQHTHLEITQRELRASEQKYRKLFENAYDAIWLHDLEGNIIAANQACAKLSGYELEELCNLKTAELLPEDRLGLVWSIEQRLVEGKAVDSMAEVKLIRKDGTQRFVQLTTSLSLVGDQPAAFQHIARDVTEQKRMQENLRFYLQQVVRAQEDERKRISRELHDETIQALVVLSRALDVLASGSEGLSEDSRLRLGELRRQTNNIIQGVRRLSQDLRPASLGPLGLLSAVESLVSDVAEYSGIAAKVNVLGAERRLPEEAELVLFRITQEALRNVWRHSQATQVEITIEFDERKTRITVSDNGKGFKPPPTMGDLARDGKLGLVGMQERAHLLGGTLTVRSEPGKGSSITVEMPI